jgi:hypothetical protein
MSNILFSLGMALIGFGLGLMVATTTQFIASLQPKPQPKQHIYRILTYNPRHDPYHWKTEGYFTSSDPNQGRILDSVMFELLSDEDADLYMRGLL